MALQAFCAEKSRPVRALLIDMDGVLFDTEKRSIESIIDIIGRQGLTITREYIVAHMGLGPKDILKCYSQHLGPRFDGQLYWDTYWRERNDFYNQHGMPVMAGIEELLKRAAEKGVPCVLASSSPQKEALKSLVRAGVDGYFANAVGGDMFEHAKPEPDIYLTAAGLVNVPIGKCLVLEDSPNGLKAGRAAGAVTCMIPDVVPFTEALRPYCDYLSDSAIDCQALL